MQLPETLPVSTANIIEGKLLKALHHSNNVKLQRMWSEARKAKSNKK